MSMQAISLHSAIWAESRSDVESLIKNGADVNTRNSEGHTPLHLASISGKRSIMRMLLSEGADVHAPDHYGLTALFFACMEGHATTAGRLLRAGALIDPLDHRGDSPLDWARDRGGMHVVDLLLRHGARLVLYYNPRSASSILANAWGIMGTATVTGITFRRTGSSLANPPLGMISQALQCYTRNFPYHRIVCPEGIISAFGIATGHYDLLHPHQEQVGKIWRGELVVFNSGWSAHSVILLFSKSYFAICNRGHGGPTKVRKIIPTLMTFDLYLRIKDSELSKCTEEEVVQLYADLVTLLNGTQDTLTRTIEAYPQKIQRTPYCAYTSSKAALYTILALQKLLEAPSPFHYDLSMREAKRIYKHCTTFFRLHFLLGYLHHIRSEDCDLLLLRKINRRLTNNWHPERFLLSFFVEMRRLALYELR